MTAVRAFADVLTRLADGAVIDWEAAERAAVDPADVEFLRQLRVLAKLEETHRLTVLLDAGPGMRPSTGGPSGDSTLGSTPEADFGGRWGRYRIVRQVGHGGFGSVYLAHDEELERDVAIKLLHPSLAHRTDLVSRVRKEGRALARVRHPNVVMVFDVEEHEGRLGLCMEFIRGRTLDDLVRNDGPLNDVEAIAVGQAVCRALAAIHQTGVLHRDVKARNVMRERAGRIVLMDLGATVDIALQDPRIDLGVGTPAYMAPELLERQLATPQSEVYAVGVLLYFLVTGEHPVQGSAIGELREAHRQGRRNRLDERRFDLPASFVRIVERATAKEPAARFESPMALLRELSQEPPLPAPPPRAPRPHVTEIVKRTLQVAVGLAAIGVVAGALANRTFNFVIARPPSFDATSFAAQVWLGMRSLILPTLIFAVMTVASSLLQLAFRLPILRRLSAVVPWQRLIGMAGKAEEEAATVLARFVVAAGFGVLVVLWFIFSDIVYGFTNIISVDSLERFAPWREQSDLRTIRYRVSYTAALFLMAAGWRAVRRIRLSTGGRTPGSIRAAGIAVAGISIAFLAAPHKLSVQNDMPVALVAGQRCYLLGERRAAGDASEVPQSLLYCPAWSVPRVRTLTGTVDMTSCGFEENVFLLSTATDCTPMAEP